MTLEGLQVDRVGEVRGEQLVALVLEALTVRGQFGQFVRAGGEAFIERGLDLCRERGVILFGDRDLAVAVSNELLGDPNRHRAAGAALPLRGSPGADVVGVADALTVGREVQLHPRPARPAEQRAFQVVVVGASPFGGFLARVEQPLHLLPGLDIDQRLVRAGLFRAFVADDPDVVRVAQQIEERRAPNRARGSLRGRHAGQPARGHVREQINDGAFPGGVLLEHPPHQRCAFGVDLDGAVLAALLITLADVEVADRGAHRGAAGLELLRQPLGDLSGEILGVELRDGRHDAVQQHPRGRLVDVLRRRYQRHARLDQTTMNLHIIEPVPGEAVDLVHDAVGHLMGGDVLQHPLQVGPVGGACGLPGVHELGHDPGAEVFCLASVRLTLGGDRESLVTPALGRLLLGRDPLIGHRRQQRRGAGLRHRHRQSHGRLLARPPMCRRASSSHWCAGHRCDAAAHQARERGVHPRCTEPARSVACCQASGAAEVRLRYADPCSSPGSASCTPGARSFRRRWMRSCRRAAMRRARLMGP